MAAAESVDTQRHVLEYARRSRKNLRGLIVCHVMWNRRGCDFVIHKTILQRLVANEQLHGLNGYRVDVVREVVEARIKEV